MAPADGAAGNDLIGKLSGVLMKNPKLFHYFTQRTAGSRSKSTYEVGDGDDTVLLRPTGSAVKALRFLLRSGFSVPDDMNGPQVKEYAVELKRCKQTSGPLT